MKKQLLIFPSIVFFFILLVFFYLLIIDRDPTELPSVLIEKKAPRFETESLLDDKKFISIEEFGNKTTIVNFLQHGANIVVKNIAILNVCQI